MLSFKKTINILNVVAIVLLLIPARHLDLFKENYSTLSLNTQGYLYVLSLGIYFGSILGIETMYINSKKASILMFLALIIASIIPHHVPYNLQGNLHLLCAYLGFGLALSITYLNIYKHLKYKKIYYLFMLSIFLAFVIYLKVDMVNTLSEIIAMSTILIVNNYLFNKVMEEKHD